MGIGRYNSEGYKDLVPQMAIAKIEKEERKKLHKWRPLVYICSPFSGDVECNTEKARQYSRFAVDEGAVPLAPHLLLPQFMSEKNERDLAMFMDMVFLGRCEQLCLISLNAIFDLGLDKEYYQPKELKKIFPNRCSIQHL